ncbi:MAG TPA: sugar phosphate isomerase/epimerase [Chthonomonadaceae bacterium]|nr:sugar phosphate isomerase/epimerase [Chthonomonadaceae bacterium]
MKLACQEALAVGTTLEEKLDNLAAAGYEGIEFYGSDLADRLEEIKRATASHTVKPASICAGYRGCPLDTDRKEREIASADIHRLLNIAGDLGMAGLIVVPIFGGPRIPDLSPLASAVQLEKDLLARLCEEWGQTAQQAGTNVLLEPLNRYETHLLKALRDATEICARVGNPNVKIMADFFHMSIEEADIPASIRQAGPYIAHVHLADSNRQLPGYGHTDFTSGFAALKEIGFNGYMALECGNPELDKQAGLKKAAEFLRAQL